MIDILAEIAQLLHEAGVGTFDPEGVNGNIFIGHMPKSPDKAIAIYPVEGLGDDLWNNTIRPSIQILTRGGQDIRTALKMAEGVYNELQGINAKNLGTFYVIGCASNTYSPVNLGADTQGRFECSHTFRFELMKEVM